MKKEEEPKIMEDKNTRAPRLKRISLRKKEASMKSEKKEKDFNKKI